jgi:hypothetical protein
MQLNATAMSNAHLNDEEASAFNRRKTFNNQNSDSNKPSFEPQIPNKSLRLVRDTRRENAKVRETDPVLLKNKPFLVEK